MCSALFESKSLLLKSLQWFLTQTGFLQAAIENVLEYLACEECKAFSKSFQILELMDNL